MRIAAQRANGSALIALERDGKLALDRGVARAGKIDEEDGAVERGREEIRGLAM